MKKAEILQKYLPCHATYGDFDLCVECPYNPNPGKIWKYGCAHGQDKMIDDTLALLKEQEEQKRKWLNRIADAQITVSPTGFESAVELAKRTGEWNGLQMAFDILTETGGEVV